MGVGGNVLSSKAEKLFCPALLLLFFLKKALTEIVMHIRTNNRMALSSSVSLVNM